jgi:CO/xanthine dehydrogenase FAD-binding subunit
MKPSGFAYRRPDTLDEALALLAEHGGEARALAGGQSLVPLMNLRLARPGVVVDVGRLAGLEGIANGDGLVLGATARQAALLVDDRVARTAPLLATAARHVAHPAIRARGTVGGSLAHADPAAELPAVAIALDAEITAASRRGRRAVPAADLFTGPFTTSLAEDELLVEVRIPSGSADRSHGFAELARRHGDFALAGACCTASVSSGTIRDARVVLFGVGPTPVVVPEAAAALEGASVGDPDALATAARAAAAASDPVSDVHASAAYRRRMADVVTRRALVALGRSHG